VASPSVEEGIYNLNLSGCICIWLWYRSYDNYNLLYFGDKPSLRGCVLCLGKLDESAWGFLDRRRKPLAVCPKRALRNELGFGDWIWQILKC